MSQGSNKPYYYGTGRRKSAIARVFLSEGSGKLSINDRSLEDYFGRETSRMVVAQPFDAIMAKGTFDVKIFVTGGGVSGQAGAIRHGISRALISFDEQKSSSPSDESQESYRKVLRRSGYVTRDPRVVERKKVGKHKARKSPQFSKR